VSRKTEKSLCMRLRAKLAACRTIRPRSFGTVHRFVIPGYARRQESQDIGQREVTRCPLGSILSAFGQGTPPMRLAVLGGQAAKARGFCPSMTAPVRPWPPQRAKTSSAVGGPRGLLSAVGQREFLVRWQRGRRSDARLFCELRESVRSTMDCTLRTKEPGPGLEFEHRGGPSERWR
jgi:hypothetical protein